MLKKIIYIIENFLKPCNPPYDCPFCMHCYQNGGEIKDWTYLKQTLSLRDRYRQAMNWKYSHGGQTDSCRSGLYFKD